MIQKEDASMRYDCTRHSRNSNGFLAHEALSRSNGSADHVSMCGFGLLADLFFDASSFNAPLSLITTSVTNMDSELRTTFVCVSCNTVS